MAWQGKQTDLGSNLLLCTLSCDFGWGGGGGGLRGGVPVCVCVGGGGGGGALFSSCRGLSYFLFFFLYSALLSLVGISGLLTWIRLQQLQEQQYPFLPVCAVFSCVQTVVYGCQCLGFVTCTQMLMHVIAHV